MRNNSYDLEEYRRGQALGTAIAWKQGVYDHCRASLVNRKCVREECPNTFEIKSGNRKKFCSRHCSAVHNNSLRGPHSSETRTKISASIQARRQIHPLKGKILVPRLIRHCKNCGKSFETPRWQNHIYCGVPCSINDIGGRPTSPRAARAKAGIRPDIDPHLYFFSRWEANFARILNLREVPWVFQPRVFQLETQKYTPDFYLPASDEYIEIKNFLSDYSKRRDEEFRRCFPHIKLSLILKADYLKLQATFASLIKGWEFATMKNQMRVGTEVVKPGAL